MSILTKERIMNYVKENPSDSMQKIGEFFGVSRQSVSSFFQRHPELSLGRTKKEGLTYKNNVMEKALFEIADVSSCDLTKDIAIRALELIK